MIAHLDASTGVSGDKFLGALLDIGAHTDASSPAFTVDDLAAAVASMAPEIAISIGRASRRGVEGVTVSVEASGDAAHRTWSDIRELLAEAAVPERARQRALAVFERLAQAEGRVHGVAPDDVHFHEVGAIDSIVDVVGVALGLERLAIERLVVSPVAVGSGTVHTAHGILPIPAPATALLLEGVPVVPGPSTGELTTPTGAALVAVLADVFGPLPPLVPRATGHGAGSRELAEAPNIARLIIGDAMRASSGHGVESVVLLESNLDHLSPEAVAHAAVELARSGALDVWTSGATMKKQRLGVVLSVLCRGDDADRLAEAIHALTGTLGVRRLELTRSTVERTVIEVETAHGPIRVKSGAGRLRPEADDVTRLARATGRSFDQMERELSNAAHDALDVQSDGEPAGGASGA
ncbi:MAG: nickel pincer cofactor biosynthesis protein LarC [Coriobacteriia bacterium]|nr:nickel pincer cofactor biosynthesis protein LarC [Coriobacteriia bacterium]